MHAHRANGMVLRSIVSLIFQNPVTSSPRYRIIPAPLRAEQPQYIFRLLFFNKIPLRAYNQLFIFQTPLSLLRPFGSYRTLEKLAQISNAIFCFIPLLSWDSQVGVYTKREILGKICFGTCG